MNGRTVVIDHLTRGHFRWVAHPWPKMVAYPEILSRGTSLKMVVAELLKTLESPHV